MQELQNAILDQKFIYEPANGLINRIECLENLWDELKAEYVRGAWGKLSTVNKEVQTADAFGQHLLHNVERFTKGPTHTSDPMTTEEKIAMKRFQIEQLQQEIARLETEGEREPTPQEMCDMLHARLRAEVERRQQMMGLTFQGWGNSSLRFSVMTRGVAWQDLG
jgi:DNA repair exonuclease SbcCD ATPase subunit